MHNRTKVWGSLGVALTVFLVSGCGVVEQGTGAVVELSSDEDPVVGAQQYEALLLDGSQIVIRSGDGPLSKFTKGVPTPVYDIGVLAEAGYCNEITDAAEAWTAKVADTDEGRRASAFAMYATSVYAYIECGKTALPVGQTDDATAIRYDTCEEAIDADGGNYLFGIDPEYVWYEDRDGDGVTCEAR